MANEIPTFVLKLRKNPRKNLKQENWPYWGSNPGQLGESQWCYTSTTARHGFRGGGGEAEGPGPPCQIIRHLWKLVVPCLSTSCNHSPLSSNNIMFFFFFSFFQWHYSPWRAWAFFIRELQSCLSNNAFYKYIFYFRATLGVKEVLQS